MFELSEFELSGVNYYKENCQIQGELDLVRVNEEFELSEFELAGDYCRFCLYINQHVFLLLMKIRLTDRKLKMQ